VVFSVTQIFGTCMQLVTSSITWTDVVYTPIDYSRLLEYDIVSLSEGVPDDLKDHRGQEDQEENTVTSHATHFIILTSFQIIRFS
jgi:hypothetical protein